MHLSRVALAAAFILAAVAVRTALGEYVDPKNVTLQFLLHEISRFDFHREVRVEFLHLDPWRSVSLSASGKHKQVAYSPRLSTYIPDQTRETNYSSYLADVQFDFRRAACEFKKSVTRDYEIDAAPPTPSAREDGAIDTNQTLDASEEELNTTVLPPLEVQKEDDPEKESQLVDDVLVVLHHLKHTPHYYYNITVEECRTIQNIGDFLVESEDLEEQRALGSLFDLQKLSVYLSNRYALQLSTISLYVLVMPEKRVKRLKGQIAQLQQQKQQYGDSRVIVPMLESANVTLYALESDQNAYAPVFIALEGVLDYGLRAEEMADAYIDAFLPLVDARTPTPTVPNATILARSRVTHFDEYFYRTLFVGFHEKVRKEILTSVENGAELLAAPYTLTRAFDVGDYQQLSSALIDLQEHVFLARQWANVLQYARARRQLEEAWGVLTDDILPLLRRNLVTDLASGGHFWLLRFVQQYTFTLLLVASLVGAGIWVYNRTDDFKVIARKIV